MKVKVTITSWFDWEINEKVDDVEDLEDAEEFANMLVSSGELTGGERNCSNFNWMVDIEPSDGEGEVAK